MTFYNETGLVWTILSSVTETTGSLFVTLLLIIFVILILCAVLRIPMELSAILIMPLLLVLMAYSGDFFAVGGVVLLYLGVLLARNFFGFAT